MNGRKIQSSGHAGLSALAGALLVAGLATSASAQNFAEYLGGGFLTVNDGCAQYGWSGTHQVMVRMEPQGVGGNPADMTQMALLFSTGTVAVRLNLDRGVRTVYAPLQATYVWNGPWTPEAPTTTFAFSPNGTWPLSGGTEMRRLTVIIDNFNEHAGCSAQLQANLQRG